MNIDANPNVVTGAQRVNDPVVELALSDVEINRTRRQVPLEHLGKA